MRFSKFFLFTGLLIGISSLALSPLELSKTFMTDLAELAQQSKTNEGKFSTESKARLKKISAEIDFLSLSKRSFGAARWNKFSSADRTDFLNTFQELLETVVYPKAKLITAKVDDLRYTEVPGKVGQVRVVGKVEREKRGEVVEETLEIVLLSDSKTQKIFDAVIEEEQLSVNLKRQFDESLKKKSFTQIIAQMKKRIEESKGATK